MADEPDRQRSQYPPPDDPNRGYYPPAPREGNPRDDKNSYPAPEDANRTGHYQQGSPATGPPRDDRMPYPPPDPSRQPPYSYDPRAGQYQPPPQQWNGQYPPPQYPVSLARLGAVCGTWLTLPSGSYPSGLSIPSSRQKRRSALSATARCISSPTTISWSGLSISTAPLSSAPSARTPSANGNRMQVLSQEKGGLPSHSQVGCCTTDAVVLDSLLGLRGLS